MALPGVSNDLGGEFRIAVLRAYKPPLWVLVLPMVVARRQSMSVRPGRVAIS